MSDVQWGVDHDDYHLWIFRIATDNGPAVGNVLDDVLRDDSCICERMATVVQEHGYPGCLLDVKHWTQGMHRGWLVLTKSRAEVRTPPAPAHIVSSPGRAKYGTVARIVPLMPRVKSRMSYWKPWAMLPDCSASATYRVDDVIFSGAKRCWAT